MLRQCSNPYVLSDIHRQVCAAALTAPDFPTSHAADFAEAKREISRVIGKGLHMLRTDERVPICTLFMEGEGNLQQILMDEGIYALTGLDFEGLNARFVRLCVPVLRSLPRLTAALERVENKLQQSR